MTPFDKAPNDSTPGGRAGGRAPEHPHVLPWYVSGQLDPAGKVQVEEHLADCAECRDEVKALESMRRTFLTYGDDLELLDQVVEPGHVGAGKAATLDRPERRRHRAAAWGWALAGAAAAALVLVVALPVLRRQPLLIEAQPIVLLPAQRGAAEAPILQGAGPWSIDVVLPLGSPAAEYRVWIDREGGGTVPGLETRAKPATGGRITVLLRCLPGFGRYEMRLAPLSAPASAPELVYPFEVTR